MPKLTFMGAGSTVFAKMLENLRGTAGAKASIRTYTRESRREALKGADFVVNAIHHGGYEPCN